MGVDDYNFSLELAECGELKHLSEMSSGQLFFFLICLFCQELRTSVLARGMGRQWSV